MLAWLLSLHMHTLLFRVLKVLIPDIFWRCQAYILEARVLVPTPQIIWIFCKIIVWKCENYQLCSVEFCHCCEEMPQMSNEHVHGLRLQHLWDFFLMIHALLSQNFDAKIYALFLQFFSEWKADPANFFAFRMDGARWEVARQVIVSSPPITFFTFFLSLFPPLALTLHFTQSFCTLLHQTNRTKVEGRSKPNF